MRSLVIGDFTGIAQKLQDLIFEADKATAGNDDILQRLCSFGKQCTLIATREAFIK